MMEFNQMAKDIFTEEELKQIEREAEQLAEQMLKESLRKQLLKEATTKALAQKQAEFKIVNASQSVENMNNNLEKIKTTTYDNETQKVIELLQKQNEEQRKQIEIYKSHVAERGYKLDKDFGKIISTDARSILENLGYDEEDIIYVISKLNGDESYDKIDEKAKQYLSDRNDEAETVIENNNEIVNFSKTDTSF